VDKALRFKFLHHCGSYWYFDEDGTIQIALKLSGALKCHQTFNPSGKILIQNDVDTNNIVVDEDGDIKLNPVKKVVITGNQNDSPLQILTLPVYANNGAAIAGGLVSGELYRNGADPDLVCVVH